MQTGLEHVKRATLGFEVNLVEAAAAAAVTSSPLSAPHNNQRFRPAPEVRKDEKELYTVELWAWKGHNLSFCYQLGLCFLWVWTLDRDFCCRYIMACLFFLVCAFILKSCLVFLCSPSDYLMCLTCVRFPTCVSFLPRCTLVEHCKKVDVLDTQRLIFIAVPLPGVKGQPEKDSNNTVK